MASEWPQPLFALPSDHHERLATITCATEDADYPASLLSDDNPAKPFKSTVATATIVFTFSSPVTLIGIALFNHNRGNTTATLTNGSGLNISIAIDRNGHDSICINPWKRFDDTASAATRTASVWTLTLPTGTGNAQLGCVWLFSALRDLNWKWGLKFKPRRDVIRHKTFGGSNLRYNKLIRIWEANGVCDLKEDEEELAKLEAEAFGDVNPFLVIRDELVNDALLMEFQPDTFEYGPDNPGISTMPMRFKERSMGPPLYAV